MDGDSPADFLQDLDLWLMQSGSASPAMHRHSLDVNAASAGLPSLEASLLTPTAPVTDADKVDTSASLLAALTDESMPWAALAATSSVDSGSLTLPPPVPEPLMPQGTRKTTGTKSAKTRKGRPPVASKTAVTSSLEPPRKKGKINKSTSQRQKEELAYLREKSDQLEVELSSLKQHNREELERQQREEEQKQGKEVTQMSTAIVTTELDEFGAPIQPEVSLWERIAKRQREEKAKAEVENVKLREMVQSQMRLVKSFERLLRKRRIWDQLQENNYQEGGESRKEDEVLQDMTRDCDSRYPKVDMVLEEHGLGEADPAVAVGDDANMKYSQDDGMYLEYKEKKYMPFDYKVLDEVVWRSFGEGKLKLEDSQLTVLKATDEVFCTRATLPLSRKATSSNENKDPGNSIILSVMKRFAEENRVVYVWSSNTSVKNLGDGGNSSVLLVQKGYAIMEPATLPDGSPGCAIRSYTSSIPTLPSQPSDDDSETQLAQHREVGQLTEMVFAAYQQSRQSINQTLENLVLDEMMAKNAASTRV
ncbi:M96 mating-specific protein [Phytophthora megakarya]|uniref:M96 mating-specific protein n=1 Tax=Phytophthora megakarya TaxID=4795 RepID=A0A225W9C3_9STRA|nr:M96 mating-specific protein [Phytophthora megakarya]